MTVSLILMAVSALICAVLSGLGVGSAGIFVLYLTIFAGYGQAEAQGLNLVFFLFSAGSALILHTRKRSIPKRLVFFLIATAIPGAFFGSYLARLINPEVARRIFGGMLVAAGLFALVGKRRHTHAQSQEKKAE